MERLKKLLEESLHKPILAIEVVSEIPKTKILIHNSHTMTIYGIEKTDQMGFTISISFQIKTNKGKKIHDLLNELHLLDDFIKFEFREHFYIKDFGRDKELIVAWLNKLLSTLKAYRPNEVLKFWSNGKIN